MTATQETFQPQPISPEDLEADLQRLAQGIDQHGVGAFEQPNGAQDTLSQEPQGSQGESSTATPENIDAEPAIPGSTNTTAELADIVKVDDNGMGHRNNGKFMSKENLSQIEAHQDQIRDGMEARAAGLKYRQHQKEMAIRTYGSQEYEARFANNPNVDPDAWLRLQQSAPAKPYEGRHRADENMPKDVTSEFWGTLDDDEKQHWGTLDDNEKQNLRIYKDAEKTANEQNTTAAVDVNEPITDPSPTGMKARLGRLMNKAGAKLQMLKMNAKEHLTGAKEYYSDEEKGKRRKIITAVAGVVAVGGAVTLAILEARGQGMGLTAHHAAYNGHDSQLPFPNGQPDVVSNLSLEHGSTAWGKVGEYAQQHGHTLTQLQEQFITNKVLQANGLDWTTARSLPDGFSLQMNNRLFEEWLKQSAQS